MAALNRLNFGLLFEQEIGRGVARGDINLVVIEFLNGCRFGTGRCLGWNCVLGFVVWHVAQDGTHVGLLTYTRMNVLYDVGKFRGHLSKWWLLAILFSSFSLCATVATAWTVRGSNPGGGEIFRTRPDRPWGPPYLLYDEYRVFPGGKPARVWRWPPTPPHLTSRLKKEWSFTSSPPLALRGL